ncbi:MAG: UDP-N-acetylmuramoyl-tripeptide--D-alanyl-D-alanine ligase [Patescibacteria group bacterium]|nr:UDP-N-acetylmuramoyl-tripeptide--D-alanyl-D-alanine ligase [Patescibacteria group bacterium]
MQFLKKIIVYLITWEAKMIVSKYKPFIIAVTGSVGKTSTKDAVYGVVKNHNAYVRKSEKSMNSEIGLPLTIIGAPNAWHSLMGWLGNIRKGLGLILRKREYPDMLVLELGADHPGDIAHTVKWLKPNIAILTKVSDTPVHVEFFDSPEQVFVEKCQLMAAIRQGGKAILFADDEKLGRAKEYVGEGVDISTYGITDKANVRGYDYDIYGLNEGMSFKVNFDGREETVKIAHVVGKQQMYPILASIAVGKAMNMSVDDIMRGVYDYEPPKGRMNVISGLNDGTIIDDTYNSSPDAVVLAIDALRDMKCSGRRIAILGDMMELGKYSAEEHRHIGAIVSKVADIVMTAGPRSHATAIEALANGMDKDNVKTFDNSDEIAGYIPGIVRSGDVILVKGSQSMRMEKVVKALLKEGQKADRLLVRQESEWLNK